MPIQAQITKAGKWLMDEISDKQRRGLIKPFSNNHQDYMKFAKICSKIMRHARRFQTIQIDKCNRSVDSQEAILRDKREERAIENLKALVGLLNLGLTLKVDYEPRGSCIRLGYGGDDLQEIELVIDYRGTKN